MVDFSTKKGMNIKDLFTRVSLTGNGDFLVSDGRGEQYTAPRTCHTRKIPTREWSIFKSLRLEANYGAAMSSPVVCLGLTC